MAGCKSAGQIQWPSQVVISCEQREDRVNQSDIIHGVACFQATRITARGRGRFRRRIEQASRAYGKVYSLWLRKHIIPEKNPPLTYNAVVLLTLLCDCEAQGPTAAIMKRLDASHQKQLQALPGVRHPQHISNADLYERKKIYATVGDRVPP